MACSRATAVSDRSTTLAEPSFAASSSARANPFEGFLVYNYAKLAVTIGYNGNFRQLVHGQVLRTDITGLARDRRRLEREIATRQLRIDHLQATLASLEGSEASEAVRRRQALEQQMREEQEAIRQATERLQQLEGTAPK
jgi:hypothetical protein